MKKLLIILLFLVSCEPATQITKPILDKTNAILIIRMNPEGVEYSFYRYDCRFEDCMEFLCQLRAGETDTVKLNPGQNIIWCFRTNGAYHEPHEEFYFVEKGNEVFILDF